MADPGLVMLLSENSLFAQSGLHTDEGWIGTGWCKPMFADGSEAGQHLLSHSGHIHFFRGSWETHDRLVHLGIPDCITLRNWRVLRRNLKC